MFTLVTDFNVFSLWSYIYCFPSRVKANREQAKCVLRNYFASLRKFHSVKHLFIEKSKSTDSNTEKE